MAESVHEHVLKRNTCLECDENKRGCRSSIRVPSVFKCFPMSNPLSPFCYFRDPDTSRSGIGEVKCLWKSNTIIIRVQFLYGVSLCIFPCQEINLDHPNPSKRHANPIPNLKIKSPSPQRPASNSKFASQKPDSYVPTLTFSL